MNSKFIRSFALLSIATLMLGACGGTKGKEEPNSSEPDPVVPVDPVVPDEKFKLPTSLEDAKLYSFRDLELPDEDELDAVLDNYLLGVNGLKVVNEYYEIYQENLRYQYERDESNIKFFQDDFVETDGNMRSEVYWMGSHIAQQSYKEKMVEQSGAIGNRVIRHAETTDLDTNYTSYKWSNTGSVSTQYDQRYQALMGLTMQMAYYMDFAGVYVGEDGVNYWVMVEGEAYQQTGQDLHSNSFTYTTFVKAQSLVEIKDRKITAATIYYEIFVDHILATGEPAKQLQLVYESFMRADVAYGELTVSPNREAFLAKAPQWAISDDEDDTEPDGGYVFVDLNPTTQEISNMSNQTHYFDFSSKSHYTSVWVEGEKIQLDVVLAIEASGTYDAIAVYAVLESSFLPITDETADSSKPVEANIVVKLAEALGSEAFTKSYDNDIYLIVDKDVKEIHFTATVDYNDVELANVVISNAELVH